MKQRCTIMSVTKPLLWKNASHLSSLACKISASGKTNHCFFSSVEKIKYLQSVIAHLLWKALKIVGINSPQKAPSHSTLGKVLTAGLTVLLKMKLKQ